MERKVSWNSTVFLIIFVATVGFANQLSQEVIGKGIKRFGLTEVYRRGNTPQVDLVLIHGVDGHPFESWKSERSECFWPVDFLPPKLQELNVRILTYGYDVDVAPPNGSSNNKIHNHGESFVAELVANRRMNDAFERPIVFVAHCLGGVILKRGLVHSGGIRGHYTEGSRSIFVSTYGVLFIGTPHTGMNVSGWWLQLSANREAKSAQSATSDDLYLRNVLENNTETLQCIDRDFSHIIRRFRVFFFHEGKPTLVGDKPIFVVDGESAAPNIPDVERTVIEENHGHMCRFEGSNSPGFEVLAEAIWRYARDAETLIQRRWIEERQTRSIAKRFEAEELHPGIFDSDLIMRTKLEPERSFTKTIFSMPFKRDKDFIDRKTLFSQIEKQYEIDQYAVVCGMGGVGKSQIAIEYAHRFQQSHPQTHVFWVYAGNSTSIMQAYQRIAQKLELPGWDVQGVDTCKLVANWLEDKDDAKWLLILDNLDNPKLLSPARDSDLPLEGVQQGNWSLLDYIPKTLNSEQFLFVTTRNRDVGQTFVLAEQCIDVLAFSIPEAKDLLHVKSGMTQSQTNESTVEELLEVLAYIPLAITQAAAFMKRSHMDISNYLKALKKGDQNLSAFLSKELQDPRRERGYPNSVFRTWKISFDQLLVQEPPTAELLSFIAVLDRQQIPEILLRMLISKDVDYEWAIGTLRGLSLLNEQSGSGETFYSIHRLLHLSLQYWLDQRNGHKRACVGQAMKMLIELLHSGRQHMGSKNFPLLLPLLFSHVRTVLNISHTADVDQRSRIFLLYFTAQFDFVEGRYDSAHQQWYEAFDLSRKTFSEHSEVTLDILRFLATVKGRLGRMEEAKNLLLLAFEGYKKTLGVDHMNTLDVVDQLALSMVALGEGQEAAKLCENNLEIRIARWGVGAATTSRAMTTLAHVRLKLGLPMAAEASCRKAIEGLTQVYGLEHIVTLRALELLARIRAAQMDYKEASEILQHITKQRERFFGAEHPLTLRVAKVYAHLESQMRT